MKRNFSRAAALALGTGLFALIALPGASMADETPPPRTMTVSGQGEVKAAPDEAVLSAGVVTQARSAAAALAANSRAMNGVFDALKRIGIPDKSVQTSDFSVTAQYQTDQHGNTTQKIIGYQVSNNVTVIVDDLGKLGSAIDALVTSGANSMGGIAFTIRDPKPLLTEARAEAVKDALQRANTYASAAGLTLGPITSIGENGDVTPRPMMRKMMTMSAANDSVTPVAAGEDSITAGVSITFEIR
jgi:uncharacterized protein YggE